MSKRQALTGGKLGTLEAGYEELEIGH